MKVTLALALSSVAFWLSACERSLPEEGTRAATIFRERCGVCHSAPMPSATKFATWEMILARMDGLMARSPVGPLPAADRAVIVDYLRRNSG